MHISTTTDSTSRTPHQEQQRQIRQHQIKTRTKIRRALYPQHSKNNPLIRQDPMLHRRVPRNLRLPTRLKARKRLLQPTVKLIRLLRQLKTRLIKLRRRLRVRAAKLLPQRRRRTAAMLTRKLLNSRICPRKCRRASVGNLARHSRSPTW